LISAVETFDQNEKAAFVKNEKTTFTKNEKTCGVWFKNLYSISTTPPGNADIPPLVVAYFLLAFIGKRRKTRLDWRNIAIPIRYCGY